jgi:hypothetical protein
MGRMLRPAVAGLALLILAGGAAADPLPRIDSVSFTRTDRPTRQIEVVIRGAGMVGEWSPHGAMVGRTPLASVAALPDGTGLVGVLADEPPDGGEIGVLGANGTYVATGKRFSMAAVVGVPRAPLSVREDCAFPVVAGRSIGPVALGMTVASLRRLGATADPQNPAWYRLGPITAKVARATRLVDLAWIDRPTLCLAEDHARRKLDLVRPTVARPAPFPYPGCGRPSGPTVGGACAACDAQGLEVCHGSPGWYPSVKVKPIVGPDARPRSGASPRRHAADAPAFHDLLRAAPAVVIATFDVCVHDCRGGQTDLVVFGAVDVVKGPRLSSIAARFTDQFVCGLGRPAGRAAVLAVAPHPPVRSASVTMCSGESGPFRSDGDVLGFAELDSNDEARRYVESKLPARWTRPGRVRLPAGASRSV